MTTREVAIADFCETGAGSTPSRAVPEYFNGNVPWVKSGELRDGILTVTEEKVSDSGIRAARLRTVPKGSLLIAMYGATVGRTALLGVDATTNQAICHVLPDPTRGDSRYLWFALRAKLPEFLARRVGGAQPNLNQEAIRSTKILLPPLAEQRRIADILDKADTIRRKRKEAIALTEELLRSTFLEMFGDPVTNPRGWPVHRLGDVADVAGGLQVTSARDQNPLLMPYLRVANVHRDRLDLSEIKHIRVTEAERSRSTLRAGDVLVVEGHGNPHELGRCSVWRDEVAGCTHQNHLIRIRAALDRLEPSFLSAFLNSESGRKQMLALGKTTSGLNTISTNNVRGVRIAVPPLDRQIAFAQFVSRTFGLRARMTERAHGEDELFNSLVARAFAGELESPR